MTEPFPPNSSAAAQKWVLRFTSRGLTSLLQFVGAVLVVFGVMGHFNFGLVAAGVVVGSLGFVLRSGFRIGGTRVGLEDLLTVEDSSLEVVGEEIRSAKGYSVRKLEDGLQYSEGEHSLSIRTKAPDSPPPTDQTTVQEMVSQKTFGTHLHSSSVMVKVSARGDLRWDPPYENEPISQDRVVEIMQRIVQALRFYETRGAGTNLPSL